MQNLTRADKYRDDILGGKTYHGDYILRLVENLEKDRQNSAFRWVYRNEIAEKYIRFIEKIKFTEGDKTGQLITLEHWQVYFIANLFGWVDRNDHTKRRFVESTLEIPRKNGKTTLAAVISLACAYLDGEARGQIYMAATAQKQARLCFETAWHSVMATEGLKARIKVSAHNLLVKSNNTFIRYISSEAGAIEGTNPSCVVFDEEHLQTTNELRDALRLGMGARKNPLFLSISTAGVDKNLPYYTHINNCKKILNNLIQNERHLVVIYEPKEGADWRDRATWMQANPNFGVSIDPELFEQDYLEANAEPSKQPGFITKRLNIWADSAKTWIDSKKWASLGQKLDLKEFEDRDAYIGLDLGSTGDFSALAILIPNETRDKFHLFMRFYIPEHMAEKRSRADMLNFKQWWRECAIKLTEGDATDYNVIKQDILELHTKLKCKPIAYDKAYASMFMIQLYNEHGIEVESFSQSVGNVSGPTKQFYEWIMNGQLTHDNNPVMAWMISNVEVYQDDANANYKIHKGKSKNKVDGPCAAVNAIGRMLEDFNNNPQNVTYIW